MIAVIFELKAKDGFKEQYLDIAASLKPLLEDMEGFISIERFQSLNDSEKLLSLSFWENEEAVIKWRNLEQHRAAQAKGRNSIFAYYRLRVATVMRDYGLKERGSTTG
nr:antibiotic biosynthesis monooxygenase [Zophobihabitans entericus]